MMILEENEGVFKEGELTMLQSYHDKGCVERLQASEL
jgi:hypothetical protein